MNSLDEDREEKITHGKYYKNRLFGADLRFASNSSYIFHAQYAVELERILSGISIQSRKGTCKRDGTHITAGMLGDKEQLSNFIKADEGFHFMQHVRGTGWPKKKLTLV